MEDDIEAMMRDNLQRNKPKFISREPDHNDARFEDTDEEASILPTYDLAVKQILDEKQIAILKDQINMDQVLVRKFGGKPVAYLPVGWYLTTLNDLVGRGNWKLKVTKREFIENQHGIVKEVYVECELIITSYDKTQKIELDVEGGATIRNNRNNTRADYVKMARADALKNAAQWFGIGLKLKSKEFQKECVEHHGFKYIEGDN